MPAESHWRALYPFGSHELHLDGHRYHYLDEGQGEPLLLVHGNPTWSFYWRHLVIGLRDQYRLVVPDHIGCGLSDKPQDYPYTLARHTANLVALVDRLDLRQATLIAHDWGGAIGLGAVVARPDRFARLVLANTAAFRARRIPWRIAVCRWPLVGPLAVRGLNGFARAALWMAVEDRRRMSPAARQGLIAPYDSWPHRVAIQRFVEDIPMSPRHPSHGTLQELERRLPSLADRPALLIWGMRDWCFTPWFLERFRQFWPHAEVVRLEDIGHYVFEEAPDAACRGIRDFLERHPLAAARHGGE